MSILDLFSLWNSYRWPPAPQIWIFHVMEHFFLLLFTSFNLCMWDINIDYFTFYCRWLKQKQIRTMLVNPRKMIVSKKLKMKKKTQAKHFPATFWLNICHVWRSSTWRCLNFHNNCTSFDIQFNAIKSLLCKTQIGIIQVWSLWKLIQDKILSC